MFLVLGMKFTRGKLNPHTNSVSECMLLLPPTHKSMAMAFIPAFPQNVLYWDRGNSVPLALGDLAIRHGVIKIERRRQHT